MIKSMEEQLIEEFRRYIISLENSGLANASRLEKAFKWVEQKVTSQMIRDYDRTGKCPICGKEL